MPNTRTDEILMLSLAFSTITQILDEHVHGRAGAGGGIEREKERRRERRRRRGKFGGRLDDCRKVGGKVVGAERAEAEGKRA